MKRIFPLLLLILCLITLASCGCEHQWQDASCEAPKTCSLCGNTEGEALGHEWADATCDTAKTCKRCHKTAGEPLSHQWKDATCTAPKICSRCAGTEGEPLGHDWLDATTEEPQTCARCGKTEGERIITDSRFTTAACREVFGSWVTTAEIPADTLEEGLGEYMDSLIYLYYFDFHHDGTMSIRFQIENTDELIQALVSFTEDTLYAEMAKEGFNKTDADAAFLDAYGMDIPAYAAASYAGLDSASLEQILGMIDMSMVYYLEDGSLYMGLNWEQELAPSAYYLENGLLMLEDSDGTFMELSPVSETE